MVTFAYSEKFIYTLPKGHSDGRRIFTQNGRHRGGSCQHFSHGYSLLSGLTSLSLFSVNFFGQNIPELLNGIQIFLLFTPHLFLGGL